MAAMTLLVVCRLLRGRIAARRERGAMSIGARIKREVGSLAVATAFFGAWFALLLVVKVLLLAEYHLAFHRWSAAIVGVLVLTKVVLVLEHVSLGKWIDARPAWVHVILRTMLYSLGVFVVMLVEHGFSERESYGGFVASIEAAVRGVDVPHVWVNVLCVTGALLGYNALSVVRMQLGDGALRKAFLTPLAPVHRPSDGSS
jgi:hypothetical protein